MSDVPKHNFWIKAVTQCAKQVWSFLTPQVTTVPFHRQVSWIYTWATVFRKWHCMAGRSSTLVKIISEIKCLYSWMLYGKMLALDGSRTRSRDVDDTGERSGGGSRTFSLVSCPWAQMPVQPRAAHLQSTSLQALQGPPVTAFGTFPNTLTDKIKLAQGDKEWLSESSHILSGCESLGRTISRVLVSHWTRLLHIAMHHYVLSTPTQFHF